MSTSDLYLHSPSRSPVRLVVRMGLWPWAGQGRGEVLGGIRFREHSGWYGSPCKEHNASCVPM